MAHGQEIVFSQHADKAYGKTPGDLVVELHQKDHGTFKRNGNDLYYSAPLDVFDALRGSDIPVPYLDKKRLLLSWATTSTQPDQPLVVVGFGMPVFGSATGEKGDLIIRFHIRFPDRSQPVQMDQLRGKPVVAPSTEIRGGAETDPDGKEVDEKVVMEQYAVPPPPTGSTSKNNPPGFNDVNREYCTHQ